MLALVGLSACQSPPPAPPSDPRIAIRGDAGMVVAAAPVVNTTEDGFTRVSVALRGTTSQDVFVACTVDWFDDSGHPVPGLMAAPRRVAVQAGEVGFCETISPNANAHLFHLTVSPSF